MTQRYADGVLGYLLPEPSNSFDSNAYLCLVGYQRTTYQNRKVGYVCRDHAKQLRHRDAPWSNQAIIGKLFISKTGRPEFEIYGYVEPNIMIINRLIDSYWTDIVKQHVKRS